MTEVEFKRIIREIEAEGFEVKYASFDDIWDYAHHIHVYGVLRIQFHKEGRLSLETGTKSWRSQELRRKKISEQDRVLEIVEKYL